ncbi:hypothetical protein AB6N30_10635 [Fusobacterium animalis]|uniref:hypothetical protein n=1 Tax=Fusobacterium animalis TaxID=76859 RepID=UPI0034DF55C1
MNAEIDISNVKLETERLILRAWEIKDLDNFFEYASVNGVGEKAGWEHHKSKDESLEILKMFIDEKKVLKKLNFKYYKDITIKTRYNTKEESTLMILKNN